jgi:mannose-6-phosphate isomerase
MHIHDVTSRESVRHHGRARLLKNPDLYPLKFREIYKPYIWGGRGLAGIGKDLGDNEIVAESWEIADRGADDRLPAGDVGDVSVVKNGPLAGSSLRDLIKTYGEDICPRTSNGRFPIIVKFIDARDRLSVQVHPDDEYARAHESPGELGKTECWYVMDAPPGAELVMGLTRGMSRERFADLLRADRVEEGLNRVKVQRGDVFFIRAGTVHTLLEGIMVCEILENSDTTYRLYDWGRFGTDGKPRPLHIEKALDVIAFPGEREYDERMRSISISYDRSEASETTRLIRCPHFNVDYLRLKGDFRLSVSPFHFHCLSVLSGTGSLDYGRGELPIRRGETVLVPRPVEDYTVKTRAAEILKTFL